MKNKYSAEEIATIVVMRNDKHGFEEITKVINSKFKTNRTLSSVSQKYYSTVGKKQSKKIDKQPKNWQDEPATRRQLRTLASLMSNGTLSERMKLADSFSERGMTKGEASDLIQLNMNKEEKPVHKKNNKHWSNEENILLYHLSSQGKSHKEISEALGRSAVSIANQKSRLIKKGEWDSLTEQILGVEEPNVSVVEETIEEEIPQELVNEVLNQDQWTRSQDLQLLVNFYEMSIDEAREAFARPYWLIAKRLEMLVDSEEPRHADLLMEAASIISKRKKNKVVPPQTPSRRERRAAKKQEKRERKAAKIQARLENKIKKIRGE